MSIIKLTMIKTKAKFDSHCPQCKTELKKGITKIAMPQVPNGSGGNAFNACWYCVSCASMFEEIGPQYGSFLTLEDQLKNRERVKSIMLKYNGGNHD